MSFNTLCLLAMIPVAYLAGSIPFGLLVGFAKSIDVRKAGSGNIGATNVGRLLGRRYFFVVFLLDLCKGLIPMLIAGIFSRQMGATSNAYTLWLAVGFAAIFGHTCSVFLKFRGGKGVATTCGAVLGLWPYFTIPAVLALGIFAITLKSTRYMSIASMTGSFALMVLYLVFAVTRHWQPLGNQLPLTLFTVLVTVMIIYRHRGNIARLRAGTESKLGSAKPTATDSAPNPSAGASV